MSQRRAALVATLLACACSARGGAPPVGAAAGGVEPAAERAVQVTDSVSVWFTSARSDTASDGTACLERVMEIRAGDRVVPIPLLYTGEIPTITNDSTIDVHIWRHCIPADRYHVHLRTGQPTRVVP